MKTRDNLDWSVAFPTVCADSNLELIDWFQHLLHQADDKAARKCCAGSTVLHSLALPFP